MNLLAIVDEQSKFPKVLTNCHPIKTHVFTLFVRLNSYRVSKANVHAHTKSTCHESLFHLSPVPPHCPNNIIPIILFQYRQRTRLWLQPCTPNTPRIPTTSNQSIFFHIDYIMYLYWLYANKTRSAPQRKQAKSKRKPTKIWCIMRMVTIWQVKIDMMVK